MNLLDLVVRRARVATAADVFDCDIGIAGGRIVALAQGLPAGGRGSPSSISGFSVASSVSQTRVAPRCSSLLSVVTVSRLIPGTTSSPWPPCCTP